jgi:hypothetical protein
MSLRWNFEIRFSDKIDIPILLNLRLDILLRVIDSFINSEKYGSVNNIKTKFSTKNFQVQNKTNFSPAIVRSKESSTSAMNLICSIDIQFIINKIVISSWSSSRHLNGIVFRQELADLQIRFIRNRAVEINESALCPFVIDHMVTDIEYAELYLREWNLIPSSLHQNNEHDNSNDIRRKPRLSSFQNATLREPSTVSEIVNLIRPIFRLAHATKVIVSLTENGSVSNRNRSFIRSGILRRKGETENFIFRNNCEQFSFSMQFFLDFLKRKVSHMSFDSSFFTEYSTGEAKNSFMIGREWEKNKSAEIISSNTKRSSKRIVREP